MGYLELCDRCFRIVFARLSTCPQRLFSWLWGRIELITYRAKKTAENRLREDEEEETRLLDSDLGDDVEAALNQDFESLKSVDKTLAKSEAERERKRKQVKSSAAYKQLEEQEKEEFAENAWLDKFVAANLEETDPDPEDAGDDLFNEA